jgi:hypothetical protein
MIGTMLFTLALFILFYTLAALSLFWDGRRKAALEKDLLQRGVRVTGYITENISPSKRSTLLPYRYEYEGKKHVGKQMVSKRSKNALQVERRSIFSFLRIIPERQ